MRRWRQQRQGAVQLGPSRALTRPRAMTSKSLSISMTPARRAGQRPAQSDIRERARRSVAFGTQPAYYEIQCSNIPMGPCLGRVLTAPVLHSTRRHYKAPKVKSVAHVQQPLFDLTTPHAQRKSKGIRGIRRAPSQDHWPTSQAFALRSANASNVSAPETCTKRLAASV